jgi:1-deoxy-D-xylulose-5-phosphate reductoisomerase
MTHSLASNAELGVHADLAVKAAFTLERGSTTQVKRQSVSILGSTGSVGINALDVIQQHPERFQVYALAAHRQASLMLRQCQAFQPRYAVLSDESAAEQLRNDLRALGSQTQVLSGSGALENIVCTDEVDTVVAAIVGAAGLPSTYAAIAAGKKVLLANKEALVMAGHLLMPLAAQTGACILPIDSEHNAIFQCLPTACQQPSQQDLKNYGIRKLLLTASGGPFRNFSAAQLAQVTPAQACAHPIWNMGTKISVDSATLMNKGLELIEACWLFAVQPTQIQVVVHAEGIVHSLVEYIDGSVLAQLAMPDMRIPLAHALAWPQRLQSGAATLDLLGKSLHFDAPCLQRFPCLGLAQQAFMSGKGAPIVLNAANEIAVDAFLTHQLAFTDIAKLIVRVLETVPTAHCDSLASILALDAEARQVSRAYLQAKI